ncbi:hypothetical protein RYX36_014417 [Vicia faba]
MGYVSITIFCFVLITLFYFLTTITLSYAVDPYFEACEPKTCGNQTITYPFYIKGIQETFCGYPGFGIACDNTIDFPILNLSNTFYTINQILYQNHSFRVSNPMFSRTNTKKSNRKNQEQKSLKEIELDARLRRDNPDPLVLRRTQLPDGSITSANHHTPIREKPFDGNSGLRRNEPLPPQSSTVTSRTIHDPTVSR